MELALFVQITKQFHQIVETVSVPLALLVKSLKETVNVDHAFQVKLLMHPVETVLPQTVQLATNM